MFHFRATGLAVVAIACLASGKALAQSASPSPAPIVTTAPSAMPVVSPSPNSGASPAPSPSPSATPSPPPHLLVFSAFGDAGYTAVGGTDKVRFTNGAASRIFDGVAAGSPYFDANGGRQLAPANDFNNSFDLQNGNVQLQINGSPIGAKLEGSFGTDADVIASNGQSRSGSNLTQAYLTFAGGPVSFLVGKFSTLAGAEVIEATGNSNYSRSYLFGEAIPFTHTGVRATIAFNPKISLVAGVNNGWDDWKFAGKKKTLEGALLITPTPGYSLTLDTYNGNDFALNGNSAIGASPVYTNRSLYDGVLTVHPTGALTLVANYDTGTQLADGTGLFSTSKWNGVAGYLNYQFTPVYGISLRKETFHDVNGFRTGIAQRLQSNTATLSYAPGTRIIVRAEYRLDASDGDNFTYRDAVIVNPITGQTAGRNHQSSFGFETIFKAP